MILLNSFVTLPFFLCYCPNVESLRIKVAYEAELEFDGGDYLDFFDNVIDSIEAMTRMRNLELNGLPIHPGVAQKACRNPSRITFVIRRPRKNPHLKCLLRCLFGG